MKALLIYLILSITLICQPKEGSRSNNDQFEPAADKFFQKALETFNTVPGATIVVVKGSKTVYAKSFGHAELENRIKATPKTNYYIASATKSFTALLAAQLDKEGIIDLNAPLTRYFPTVTFHTELEADNILVKDLLTHTSGLENDPITFRLAYTGDHSHKLLVDLLEQSTANKAGRGNFQYSNLGYNIYGLIVEDVTGKTWQELLQEKIFEPAGMDRTTAYMSKAENENWPMARPYATFISDPVERIYLEKKDNTMQSAGGLITTGNDLAKWLKIQINSGKLKGKQIFPEALIDQSHFPQTEGTSRNNIFTGKAYGYGWQIGEYKNREVLWHFGGFTGSFTHVSFLPEQELGIAVLINDGAAGYYLMNLFASFAYDWWLENKETDYYQELEMLKEQFQKASERVQNGRAERANRSWQLSRDFAFYSGTYSNDLYGKIHIKGSDDKIEVSMGILNCLATPYTKEETIRVELVPGSGEVIEFQMEEGIITGLRNGEETFRKVK